MFWVKAFETFLYDSSTVLLDLSCIYKSPGMLGIEPQILHFWPVQGDVDVSCAPPSLARVEHLLWAISKPQLKLQFLMSWYTWVSPTTSITVCYFSFHLFYSFLSLLLKHKFCEDRNYIYLGHHFISNTWHKQEQNVESRAQKNKWYLT